MKTKMQLEMNLYDNHKSAWSAYIYMQYSDNRELILKVWESLSSEAQDNIRVLRRM